ncbi:hypothetical protein B5X24_HaOG202174 [Helicoverpa armigera]|uniref:Uncharacterized protein n=1 Tax=Helicoverpa armigera TaxID=29058 RepID=A0A2W1BZZ2_HELAM|nr:hypothetical protein B5X24_HaOG202174 [Helicoverpa armigera]
MNYECEAHNSGSRAALNAAHAVAAARRRRGQCTHRATQPTPSLQNADRRAANKERRSRANSSRSASCIIVIDGWTESTTPVDESSPSSFNSNCLPKPVHSRNESLRVLRCTFRDDTDIMR